MPNYDNQAGIVSEAPNFVGYDISNLMYPADLQDMKYGGHRVLFMINVMGGGKIVQKETEAFTEVPPNSITKRAAGERVADVAKAVLQSSLASNQITKPKNYDFSKTKKRLVSAISLYVPEALQKNYSVDWGTENGSSMMMGESVSQALLKGGEAASNAKGGFGSGALAAAGASAKVGASAAAAMILNDLRYVQKATGMTPGNSKAQLLFNQVDFGQFTFDYKFAPRDATEAQNVINIIRMFRHHMLPEFFDEAQFLYIYPSEFEIAYYFGTEENPHLEKHITAVLTNLTVNYNANGQFMTFENGMPTHINLTLQFKELGTPSKETSSYKESGA